MYSTNSHHMIQLCGCTPTAAAQGYFYCIFHLPIIIWLELLDALNHEITHHTHKHAHTHIQTDKHTHIHTHTHKHTHTHTHTHLLFLPDLGHDVSVDPLGVSNILDHHLTEMKVVLPKPQLQQLKVTYLGTQNRITNMTTNERKPIHTHMYVQSDLKLKCQDKALPQRSQDKWQ